MTSADAITQPFGFRLEVQGPQVLIETSARLHRWELRDSRGLPVGELHGAILRGASDAVIDEAKRQLWFRFPIDTREEFEREALGCLNGSFIVVTTPGIGNRLYPDSAGTVPIVYDPHDKRAGASADQILDDEEYGERLDRGRVERLVLSDRNGGWIPGTLTAHHGVSRLLPNHSLDLATFVPQRFWPTDADGLGDSSTDAGVCAERIAEALHRYVVALSVERNAAVALTAGWDSRLLLAATRESRPQLPFFTFAQNAKTVDPSVASAITNALDLKHRVIPTVSSSPEAQARWDRLVGHVVREVNRQSHPSLAQVAESEIVTGTCGEFGRAFLYKRDADLIEKLPLSPEGMIGRLRIPSDPMVRIDVDRWLEGVPDLTNSATLDLAYLELRFASWAMGQAPAQKALKFSWVPFAQRVILHSFLSAAPRSKADNSLFHKIASRLWPETLAFPVNRYGDSRDLAVWVKKTVDRDKIVRLLRGWK